MIAVVDPYVGVPVVYALADLRAALPGWSVSYDSATRLWSATRGGRVVRAGSPQHVLAGVLEGP